MHTLKQLWNLLINIFLANGLSSGTQKPDPLNEISTKASGITGTTIDGNSSQNNNTPPSTAPKGQRDNRNRRGGGGVGGGSNATNRQKTQNQAAGDATTISAPKKEPLVNGSS